MRRKQKAPLALQCVKALVSSAFLLSTTPAAAGERTMISGTPKIVDGRTLQFNGMPVRLWGIDAPGGGQKCGKTDAAALAEKSLKEIVGDRRVTCELRDYDGKDKQAIASCSVDGEDVAGQVVEHGWAWDLPKSSNGAYKEQQTNASKAMKGVHILSCDLPSKWRAEQDRASKKKAKKLAEKAKARKVLAER